ncbi:hypothetical protein GQ600_25748 [Phytophthora cactorum]|nr:hypothetical protein GQ600_25748 [Phytophthora cactorum]
MQDAFLVCSSALKLQFRESLDQELFLAYVEDWVSKRETLQLTESSSEYQAATRRVQDLKEAIGRAHELAQTSQEKLALDDPSRESLAQEVRRVERFGCRKWYLSMRLFFVEAGDSYFS